MTFPLAIVHNYVTSPGVIDPQASPFQRVSWVPCMTCFSEDQSWTIPRLIQSWAAGYFSPLLGTMSVVERFEISSWVVVGMGEHVQFFNG